MTLSLRRQAKSKRLFLSLHNIPDIHGLKAEVYAAVQKLLFKIIPNREVTSEDQGGCATARAASEPQALVPYFSVDRNKNNFVTNALKMGTDNNFPK